MGATPDQMIPRIQQYSGSAMRLAAGSGGRPGDALAVFVNSALQVVLINSAEAIMLSFFTLFGQTV
jgi:hypothetical protein